jgi:hypothetical protein
MLYTSLLLSLGSRSAKKMFRLSLVLWWRALVMFLTIYAQILMYVQLVPTIQLFFKIKVICHSSYHSCRLTLPKAWRKVTEALFKAWRKVTEALFMFSKFYNNPFSSSLIIASLKYIYLILKYTFVDTYYDFPCARNCIFSSSFS